MDDDEGEEFGSFKELRPFGEIVAFAISILGTLELLSFRVLMTLLPLEQRPSPTTFLRFTSHSLERQSSPQLARVLVSAY